MPFANLPIHEKDAFFALLDEYFTSRPDLLSRVSGAAAVDPAQERTEMPPIPTAALTTAAQRALANPAATRMLASGIQRAATTGGRAGGGAGGGHHAAASAATMAPLAAAALPSLVSAASAHGAGGNKDDRNVNAHPPSTGVGFGRVAAAAQAFSGSGTAPATSASPPAKAANPNKLVPQKKFGDVDVSSAGAMFRSLRGSTAAKNAPPPTVYTPPAFTPKKATGTLPPPPVRRVSAAPAAPTPEPEEDAEPEPEQEEEAGAWAEALYDYTSEEASDLHLRAGERVLVTEQTSSDWWTGEIDGRGGLFPASYVKLL